MFQLGQQNRVFGHWESESIKVTFGYRKPTHLELLDLELEASAFDSKWFDWDSKRRQIILEVFNYRKNEDEKVSIPTLIGRMDEAVRRDWADRLEVLKSTISSEDIAPVISFISEHVITVDGLMGSDGEPIKLWADVDESGRAEIMSAMSPHELASLYGEIKRSAMLKASEKKP